MSRFSAKEINRRKVKQMMKLVQTNEISKMEVVKDLNNRLDRMKIEDEPWYEDLYPKYISLMRIS